MAFIAIKEICDLFSGFPLSSKDFVENGNACAIQSGSISRSPAQVVGDDKMEEIQPSSIDFIIGDELREARQVNICNLKMKKTIYADDIIFRARASSIDQLMAYTQFLSKDYQKTPHIVSNAFIVLRPKEGILPSYIEWAINNFRNGLYAHSSKSGTASLHTVSLKQLGDIVLPMPSMKVQKQILEASKEIENIQAILTALDYSMNELLCGLARRNS